MKPTEDIYERCVVCGSLAMKGSKYCDNPECEREANTLFELIANEQEKEKDNGQADTE